MIEQNDFIASLKRDRARGNLAPHQIILLISFFNLGKHKLNIDELVKEFNKNWEEYKHLFKSNNRNIGMPLKAMLNKGLIEIKVNDTINDYKNRQEILLKIVSILINENLTKFFKSVSKEYLELRIET